MQRQTRTRLRGRSLVSSPILVLCAVLSVILQGTVVAGQILSASFTPCLRSVPQAPSDQLLNVSSVFAQLDLTGNHDSAELQDQAILRLVAEADTGIQSEGFSNVTNYLATLIVETSLLSFVPYSNQSSLCSAVLTAARDNSTSGQVFTDGRSNLTAASYPDPGGCPYGPGPLLIGYQIPLGRLGNKDYYPLSTLATRIRVLDTSYPPLQLACVDVQTTPYYSSRDPDILNDASAIIHDVVLWLPVALFIAYAVINIVARLYAAHTAAQQDREAALASSLSGKLANLSFVNRVKEVLSETATGRSVVRSRSLTRYVTPGVSDVLWILQWMALVGMCSVRWQGFAYPIFARVGWSMLLFNTTLVTPAANHTDPASSTSRYPPTDFQFNSVDLFSDANSPFYFAPLSTSNLLNVPSTAMYNNGNASSPGIYPAEAETQGMASFAAHLGLQPQDLFANCLTFFAILLLATLVFTLLLPVACLVIRRAFSASHAAKNPSLGRGHHAHHSSASSFGGEGYGEAPTTHLSRGRFDSIVLSGTSSSKELNYPNLKSAGNKYGDVPVTPSTAGDGYIPSLRSPTRQGRSHGIHRWWEGDKERHSRSSDHSRHSSHSRSAENAADPVPPSLSIYHSIPSWFAFFQGSVIRLVIFFHLPITTFAVYQLAHASSSATIVTVVFATCVLVVFSLAIPAYTVFHIRKTLTRYLQDDTNTLLAYGPAYNTYAQDSYTFAMVRFTANFVEGCVVGGAQNRATIQVAIILAVEIVETLVTSIWLPWGEGAAQGPLQFILSVSRIITAVLLIVISPSVSVGSIARGWICYVVIVLQVLVILILLLVLLCKLVELVFRIAGRVPFDESRNSKSGGLLGAFRKKGVLGFRRGRMQSRRMKNSTSENTQARAGHTHKESDIDNIGPMQRPRRPSELHAQPGFLSSNNRGASTGRYNHAEDDDDAGYIMSAWRGSGPDSQEPGYMAPGAYSAVHTQQDGTGFSVVRGGRANDTNPYMLQDTRLPAGAAARPTYDSRLSHSGTSRSPPAGIDTFATPLESQNDGINPVRRARAASQSAVVEFVAQGEASPNPGASDTIKDSRRQSAPIPTSPRAASSPQNTRRPISGIAAPTWKRESSTGSGFFHSLFRGNTKSGEGEVDDWTDSDDSDVETLARSHRRWPFARNKRKSSHGALSLQNMQATHPEIDEEDRALEAWRDAPPETPSEDPGPSSGKSFVVVRQPNPR